MASPYATPLLVPEAFDEEEGEAESLASLYAAASPVGSRSR